MANNSWLRMQRMQTISSTRRLSAVFAITGVLISSVALGGCGAAQIKLNTEDPSSWRHRSIWKDRKGDTEFVMVVGTTNNGSLDRSMSMDAAEQDARERLSIYLNSTVKAFRERLSRRISSRAKKVGNSVTDGSQQTDQIDRAGKTIAENTVRGLEIINSYTDEKSDTFFVLGRLNLEEFRKSLTQSDALSKEERAEIARNSDEVRREMDDAFEDARSSAKQ